MCRSHMTRSKHTGHLNDPYVFGQNDRKGLDLSYVVNDAYNYIFTREYI